MWGFDEARTLAPVSFATHTVKRAKAITHALKV